MSRIAMAVIGDPIEHSFSPIIHETVLSELGIDCEYSKIHVLRGELGAFIDGLDRDKMIGFNVTMPHKTEIMRYMDEISEEAVRYNAVNTVKVKDGRLIGYNTDAGGYVRAAADMGCDFRGKRVLVLGAGGVSSTLCLKLSGIAEAITVANRSLDRAEEVAERVRSLGGAEIRAAAMDMEGLNMLCRGYDVLINATPLGMSGIDDDYTDFEFLKGLNDGAFVSDLIYNPKKTRLLENAERFGYGIINGLGMLIYQGLLADEIFLEKTLDFKGFYKKIENKSENYKK